MASSFYFCGLARRWPHMISENFEARGYGRPAYLLIQETDDRPFNESLLMTNRGPVLVARHPTYWARLDSRNNSLRGTAIQNGSHDQWDTVSRGLLATINYTLEPICNACTAKTRETPPPLTYHKVLVTHLGLLQHAVRAICAVLHPDCTTSVVMTAYDKVCNPGANEDGPLYNALNPRDCRIYP